MNIYLDIDGVLLANDNHASLHVDEFVQRCIDSGAQLFWLTTWCRGDDYPAIRRLKQTDMNPATIELLAKHCQPANWQDAKTDAIDFTQPFLWFDDDCFEDERVALREHDAFDNWIEVELHKNPAHLADFVRSFPLPIQLIE